METCQRCNRKRIKKFSSSDIIPRIRKRNCYNCMVKITKVRFLNKDIFTQRKPFTR